MDMAKPQSGFRTVLKNRSFLLLWLAQLISMTILNAANYALIVLIQEITGSTTLIGLAIITFSLPAVLFGALAGVFVDRISKRRVLWGSNFLRAIASFGFVISLLLNRHQLIPIYLLAFLISTISQFFIPAEGSTIPLLVNEEELVPALSLFNITLTLSQAVGFILFAPIILTLLPNFNIASIVIHPVDVLYTLVGLLYLVCTALIILIPATHFLQKRRNHATQFADVLHDVVFEMRQGWRFVRGNPRLYLAVIQLSFAGSLVLIIAELATPIVTQLLLFAPNAMALVFVPAGIGLVAGSIFMPRITQRLGKSRAILLGTAGLGLSILLVPLSTFLARVLQPHGWNTNPVLLIVIVLLLFTAGVGLDLVNIPAQTVIQEQTPERLKGRVLALQLVFYNFCSIPILLFIGALADLFGIARVLYLIAVSIAAFGIWSFRYERSHAQQSVTEAATQDEDGKSGVALPDADKTPPEKISH